MKSAVAFLAAVCAAMPVAASPTTAAGQGWNALARADVEAALALIESNHPGAAEELGDKSFQALLSTARANAEARLPKVADYGGHAAVLSGLANDFRDGHIWSNAAIAPAGRGWAGLIMSRSGGRWTVGAQEAADGEPDLKGAALVSCDGIDADRLARNRLGDFHAHPEIEADMARVAAKLLLDDQNPFLALPRVCRFQTAAGAVVDHRLNWRQIALSDLGGIAGKAYIPGQAGLGVSAFDGGQWISLGTLDNRAAAVVEQVRAQQDALRAAPTVVVDMRGNSGGNSHYASEIAAALVGDEPVAAASRPGSKCVGAFWRASSANREALANFVAGLPDDRRAQWQPQAEDMEAAVQQGRAFSPALPQCARGSLAAMSQAPSELPASAMAGRLIIITDRTCFSSCLLATEMFRRLGALHVGEATDMSTRFMEVREILLPSGLRTFSTLQKVAVGLGDFGPYEPKIVYPGALHDEQKLKAWVAALPN